MNNVAVTVEGEGFFDWFHAMYENAFEELEKISSIDVDFNLFDIRLNNTLSTSIEMKAGFRHSQEENNQISHTLMHKLCDIWFCYEALLIAFKSEGLVTNPRSKINALSEETLNVIDLQHDIFDVRLDFWGMNGDLVHKGDHRADMQQYIDHLQASATSREQKEYLPQVFNLFTNNDQFSIPQILSFAYAVRNQFVHAGESPLSGVQFVETKIAALKFSYDFLVLFCLRAGEFLLEHKINKASGIV
ncbi:hypothetical protein V6255_17910 [Psychromonas arctica]|uniref:Apea-like HEPN domain-containing protein n=1 Tax=Psychromonas arctica TaxID=168275 RepID=A0ABU9HGH1_9GAMM